jgi:serine phosphatase RsbU (regulator of sigma subunit)/pSer/pThr/pTyr-binding forkhead associated (FHA) protein
MSERPRLLVRPPTGKPTEYFLEKELIRVGRHRDNDLRVNDPWLSRFHADISEKDGLHYIEDHSQNGTQVNHEPASSQTCLRHGDVIHIGDTEIIYLSGIKTLGSPGEPLVVPPELLLSSVTGPQSSWDQLEWSPSPSVPPGPETLRRHYRILQALNRASRVLIGRYSVPEVLEYSLQLVFDTVAAERGFIALVRGDSLETKARRVRDHVKDPLKGREFSRSIVAKAIEERVSILIPDALHDPGLRYVDSVSDLGVRSAACAPLWNRKAVTGVLYVDNLSRENQFDADDLTFLTSLANMIAVSLTNAEFEEKLVDKRRLDADAERARLIVSDLLPHQPPSLAGWDLAASSNACYEVGGDYFDFILGPSGRVILALGDVAGKGIPAAMMMVLLRASVHAAASGSPDVRDIAAHAHTMLLSNSPPNLYATLFLADLDPATGEMCYVNAGHVPPLLRRAASGAFERLTIGGPPAGLMPGQGFDADRLVMEAGDVLSVVSDGITDAGEEQDRALGSAGVERVMDIFAGATARELLDAIMDAAERQASGDRQADDTTVMVVRRSAES